MFYISTTSAHVHTPSCKDARLQGCKVLIGRIWFCHLFVCGICFKGHKEKKTTGFGKKFWRDGFFFVTLWPIRST